MATRVRFAPSPTGFLHLGGLRTALFNYLVARQTPGGRFIVRIEDTDQTRSVPGATDQLLRTLQWAGLHFDEGPGMTTPLGPYIQSQRLERYHRHAEELLGRGEAYRCFCSKERLLALKSGPFGRYDRSCRRISAQESTIRAAAKTPFTVRLRIPDDPSETTLQDAVFGTISTAHAQLDDAILLKSDGFPTYHFANVVDDHLMDISLVMRGQEWIASTPLHLLLYRAFGWTPPRFAHLPLLVNRDGSKLSKRQNDSHVSHYMNAGFLPDALLNFVAFLGWTPSVGQSEVLSLSELAAHFALDRVNRSDATVNFDKLKWLNRQHMQRLLLRSDSSSALVAELAALVARQFPEASPSSDYLLAVLNVLAERIFFIRDIPDKCAYFFRDPVYTDDATAEMLAKLRRHLTETQLHEAAKRLAALSDWSPGMIAEWKGPIQQMLLRLVVTGCPIGAPIAETIAVLGVETCRRRAANFIRQMSDG